MRYIKWIFGFVGWAYRGLTGALLGYLVGSLIEDWLGSLWRSINGSGYQSSRKQYQQQRQQDQANWDAYWQQFEQMFRQAQQGQQGHQGWQGSYQYRPDYSALNSAYAMLEVSPSVSDDELKAAYRKMAIKHHPDKVASLGPEAQKAAEEKFSKIQAAYETIKKHRGMA